MYETIEQITDMFRRKEKQEKPETKTYFFTSLNDNIAYIKNSFSSADDLTVHEMILKGARAAVISIDNMINKEILAQGILRPVYSHRFFGSPEKCLEDIEYKLLYTDDITEITTFEELYKFIMSGFAVIAVDGCSKMLSIGIQGYRTRGISEPESDIIQRGSKEGFVEALRTNITLIRRRIKNTELKFEILTAGEISSTELCICYLENTVSPCILDEFRSLGITERPDTLCGKITEGRIGILIDGVPSALIVPYLFAEYFQTLDDYSNRPYFAVFTRLIKFAAFFISILLPGIYTSLGTFDPEMFPTLTLNKIAVSIAGTPLSLMAETILILLVYEIMRESGLRMPQPLGYAVSIVGGLVIGDAAINAGLIGAPTLMVVAVSAICSYTIPNLYAPAAILRIIFTVAGGITGIWGIAAVFCVVFINVCAKTSFGIPYTAPITPPGASMLRDVFIRAGWKTLSQKNEKIQDMPGAEQ